MGATRAVTRFGAGLAGRGLMAATWYFLRRAIKMLFVVVIGAFTGWWWDTPGRVKNEAVETPWERWAQWSSAAFIPPLACGLAIYQPANLGPFHLGIGLWPLVVAMTAFASVVVARRWMAFSRNQGWPLKTLWRAHMRWSKFYGYIPLLLVLLGWIATAVLVAGRLDERVPPMTVSLPFLGGASAYPAIGPALVVVVSLALAVREASWRTSTARFRPTLAQVHGVPQPLIDEAILMPTRSAKGAFTMVSVHRAVVARLGEGDRDLTTKVAAIWPSFEAQVVRSAENGEVKVVVYKPVTDLENDRRTLGLDTNGLLHSVHPVEPENEIVARVRPDQHEADLVPGVSRSKAAELDEAMRRTRDLSLVQWSEGHRKVRLARLAPMTLAVREQMSTWRSCAPWDLDLAVRTEAVDPDREDTEERVTGIRVLRQPPLPTEPVKRRDKMLELANTLWPSHDEKLQWRYSEPKPEQSKLVLAEDPLDVVIPFDVALGEAVDPSTPWHLGVDEDGSPVLIDLAGGAHMLIAGATRSGKSVGTYSLLVHVLRMQAKARLLVADPNDTTVAPFEETDRLAWSTTSTHPKDVADMLAWVRLEMDRRKPILREMKTDKISTFTEELPLIFVVIDEAANYLRHHDEKERKRLEAELLAVVSQGAKYGIRLVLITQRPDSNILSTSIRSQLSVRISFRLEQIEDTKMVFPDIDDPASLLWCKKGQGWMREVGEKPRRFRSVYLADHWGAAASLPYSQPNIDVSDEVQAAVKAKKFEVIEESPAPASLTYDPALDFADFGPVPAGVDGGEETDLGDFTLDDDPAPVLRHAADSAWD